VNCLLRRAIISGFLFALMLPASSFGQAADGSDYSKPLNPKFKITFVSVATNPFLVHNATATNTDTTISDIPSFDSNSTAFPDGLTIIASKSGAAAKGFTLGISSPGAGDLGTAPGQFADLGFLFNGVTTCSDETGFFVFTKLAVEYRTFPVTNGVEQRRHVRQIEGTFGVGCGNNSKVLTGTVQYSDDTKCGALDPFLPEPDCTGSGGTTGGTGGTDGNGGSGGTTPTVPITPTAPTIVLPDSVFTSSIPMVNSDSTSVSFTTFIPATTTGNVTLTATTDADNILASITPSVIKPGDTGDGKITIQTTPSTVAGEHIVTLTASDGTVSSSVSIHVTVICDPPFILGIDQPKGTTVSLGRPALLSVKASGSGPLTYQWFTGSTGLVNFPLAGGTSSTFTTSGLNDTASYWVRVTNPCGSVNSQTATINVSPSKSTTNPRR
jgi:hypothetical protein